MSTSADDSPYIQKPSFDPLAVVCSRGRFPHNTYDAELQIFGAHYILQSGLKTREDAQKIADAKKEELSIELMSVVTKFTRDLKQAKE